MNDWLTYKASGSSRAYMGETLAHGRFGYSDKEKRQIDADARLAEAKSQQLDTLKKQGNTIKNEFTSIENSYNSYNNKHKEFLSISRGYEASVSKYKNSSTKTEALPALYNQILYLGKTGDKMHSEMIDADEDIQKKITSVINKLSEWEARCSKLGYNPSLMMNYPIRDKSNEMRSGIKSNRADTIKKVLRMSPSAVGLKTPDDIKNDIQMNYRVRSMSVPSKKKL